ncbi:hypothetical protein [Bradyrhizobium sp. BR 1433]|uniref:hypothetical protein n=1 Tax=Bradyrhizobium sp. BR 1433 TaxID=3447967 RepID=UPI003EE80D34
MSYSFSVTAANKAAAKLAVAARFDEVIGAQPIHARDRELAIANANAAIDMLTDDDTMHVMVSLGGSVGWREPLTDACDNQLTAASISASAWLVATPS